MKFLIFVLAGALANCSAPAVPQQVRSVQESMPVKQAQKPKQKPFHVKKKELLDKLDSLDQEVFDWRNKWK
jgi:hypothetical protein